MRWYIIRTLLYKEILRHRADRGGIFLALLLMAAALLLSIFGKADGETPRFTGGVQAYYVDYWVFNDWISKLTAHPPRDMKIYFRSAGHLPVDSEGQILYPQSTGAVQIRLNGQDGQGRPRYVIQFWYPGKNPAAIAALVEWFWKETLEAFHDTPVEIVTAEDQIIYPGGISTIQVRPEGQGKRPLHKLLIRGSQQSQGASDPLVDRLHDQIQGSQLPLQISEERLPLKGSADERSMFATALVLFALIIFCVYLLPALTCEERERGVLLAQALSPASTQEILLAKFLFYPAMGIGLGAALAGIYTPAALARPFFWIVLLTSAFGYMGIGLTIASLAKTQRMASMGALCYMLTVTMILFITERFHIPSFQYLALEFYSPRIIHAAMEGSIGPWHWLNLLAAMILSCCWAVAATVLFRRRGWQ